MADASTATGCIPCDSMYPERYDCTSSSGTVTITKCKSDYVMGSDNKCYKKDSRCTYAKANP